MDEFDKCVCAEIPDPVTHPRLYAILTRNVLHGICDQRCLTPNNDCSKHFPKEPNEITRQPEVEHPMYCRHCRHDHVKTNQKGEVISTQTDRQVVTYNLYFTLRFNCHINFEVVSTVSVVKYLYKYVYKGPDWASVRVAEVDVNPDQPKVIDEILNYVDAIYLSASECLWHLFGFQMQDFYPTVQN